MAEMQGMLAVTPELEAQGRMGDTEVGTIDIDAVVIPVVITNDEKFEELRQSLEEIYTAFKLDINQFTVTPDNTNYSIEQENTQAHLTNGELVIPPGILQKASGLSEALEQLFNEVDINYNEFVVGHSDNKINSETGLPEFGFFSSIWKGVKNVVKGIGKAIESVVRSVRDIAKDVWDGLGKVGQTVIDVGKDVLTSPIGTMVLSSIPAFAPYAQYIGAASKIASGNKLTAADFLSLGVKGYSDITGGNFTIDPNITKAIGAVERVQDGADIKDVLISEYGGNFAKKLGLDTKVKDTLTGLVGEEESQWLSENIDFNQAAADLAAGTQPVRLLANQFGDKIANYVGSDDPNMKALGYAGIKTAIGLDEGLSFEESIYRGGREYFDRGGQIPDFGEITGSLDFSKLNLPDLSVDMPDLNMTDWLKSMNIDVSNIFDNFELPEIKSMDLDWAKLNIGDYDFSQLKDIFNTQGISVPDMPDLGVDLSEIDLGKLFDFTLGESVNIETPQKSKLAQLAEQQQEEDTFENPLLGKNPLLQTEELPISRQLLSSLNLGTTV